MTLITRLFLAFLLFVGVGTRADEPVDLYRADALVKSQSSAQRAAAAKHALEDTLVRVSGNASVASEPAVREALVRPEDFIYQYSYASTDETLEGPTGEPVPAYELELKFSSVLVEQLLREAGLSFWPANRPAILMWVVQDTPSGPEVVNEDSVWKALQEAGKRRGLPLTAPTFDLEDRLAVSARALWQLDESAIREGSERYAADAIVVLRYSTTSSGQVRGNWQLLHVQGDRAFDGQSDSVAGIAERAIGSVADHFASMYAISPSEKGDASIVMRLSGIDSFAAFKAVQSYLSDLALVRRVQLDTLTQSVLTLRLYTEGDLARLEDTLALDGRLLPASDSFSLPSNRYLVRGTPASPLRYRLAP